MKKKDLFQYFAALNAVSSLKWVKFAIAVAKNKKLIQNEAEPIEKWGEALEWFKEYESKRVKLCENFADKDENWKPVTVWPANNSSYKIKDQLKFEAALNILREEYKDAIQERDTQIKDYIKVLEEEIPIEFSKVKEADLPSDITAWQLWEILFMIDA